MSQRKNQTREFRNLQCELLEGRHLLHGIGIEWTTDLPTYSISFVSDGTKVGPKESQLFAKLDHLGEPEVWQETIVRGFQTWAKHTNSELLVVSDDGTDLGVAGPVNLDPRFGDIRVAAVPFRESVSSTLIDTANHVGRTWVGDLILNSNAQIQTLDDLFALSVHEAGHLFGLDHSDDPNSPLFGEATPTSLIPTDHDLIHLAENYSPRAPDNYDIVMGPVEHGNSDQPIALISLDRGDAAMPTVVYGNVLSAEDVDTYQIREIAEDHELVSVTLITEGVSQLRATLELKSFAGEVFASIPFDGTSPQQVQFDLLIPEGVDQETLLVEVSTSAEDAPYDAGKYSLLFEQRRLGTARNVLPVFENCVTGLTRSKTRTRTPNELHQLVDGCRMLAAGEGAAPIVINMLNGTDGQNPVIGPQPVDPTEASFCGFDWLDDLFSCLIWGDINEDGQVTFTDFLILSTNYGKQDADPEDGDIDRDGEVGFTDFLHLSRNYEQKVSYRQIDDLEFGFNG